MLIKIDFRETKLIQLCSALIQDDMKNIQLKSDNLPLGDIIICDDTDAEHAKEKVIIERKSLNDLAASIRDGRYAEQGYRLNECDMPNHHIYYLIEGDLRYYRPFKGLPDKKALLSAMVSISYFKGFSVFRTNNLDETAEWIMHFAQKLQKEGPVALPYYQGGAIQTEQTSYTEVANTKRIKKEHITPANIGEIMLSQIPNVSAAAAMAIMRKFSTMKQLIAALQQDVNALNEITVETKNATPTQKNKKLTKPCINNIYQYLINPPVITIDT